MSTAKAKPRSGCQGVAGQREPGPVAEGGDVVSFPRSPTTGFLSDCLTGALVPLKPVQI
jgi:hypothetical protein